MPPLERRPYRYTRVGDTVARQTCQNSSTHGDRALLGAPSLSSQAPLHNFVGVFSPRTPTRGHHEVWYVLSLSSLVEHLFIHIRLILIGLI